MQHSLSEPGGCDHDSGPKTRRPPTQLRRLHRARTRATLSTFPGSRGSQGHGGAAPPPGRMSNPLLDRGQGPRAPSPTSRAAPSGTAGGRPWLVGSAGGRVLGESVGREVAALQKGAPACLSRGGQGLRCVAVVLREAARPPGEPLRSPGGLESLCPRPRQAPPGPNPAASGQDPAVQGPPGGSPGSQQPPTRSCPRPAEETPESSLAGRKAGRREARGAAEAPENPREGKQTIPPWRLARACGALAPSVGTAAQRPGPSQPHTPLSGAS